MQVFGEGNNRQMETKIRELLAVAHPEVTEDSARSRRKTTFTPECGNTTQETYVGEVHGRGSVENMNGHHAGEEVDFMPPHSPADGRRELAGRWKIENGRRDFSRQRRGAREVRYHARSMYAVLSLDGSETRARQPASGWQADGKGAKPGPM